MLGTRVTFEHLHLVRDVTVQVILEDALGAIFSYILHMWQIDQTLCISIVLLALQNISALNVDVLRFTG